jgi:hypothetical protein
MEDFNTVVNELTKRLEFTAQTPDGTIIWYAGTIEYLFKLIPFIPGCYIKENYDSDQTEHF